MRNDFQCYRCGGQSVILPEELDEDAVIRCTCCGATRGTLRDLRRIVAMNRKLHDASSVFSGC